MNKTNLTWVIAALVLASLAFTGWRYIQQGHANKLKYKSYLSAKATVLQRMPERVTRYGAKQARYILAFNLQDGSPYQSGNCMIGGGYKAGDTLTIYYNPANPSDEIITALP
jgi:hypothetical protein